MSKESKIAGVLLAGVTALLVAFFTPVGDWIARQFLPDEKEAQATAERLRDLVGNEFTVRGSPKSIRLLCNPAKTPTGWHLTSVTGTSFVLRRDRTPDDLTDGEEHPCSPWDDCENKPWTYDLFEANASNVRELKTQGCTAASL